MTSRNHDNEYQDNVERRYAYDFDGVVRGFLMRTISPFFRPGSALEIGCFEGDSTKLLAEYFPNLSVLEASADLIDVARSRVSPAVSFFHGTIETAQLVGSFENILLVHTLEHLDEPIAALERIGSWLSPGGRLFVVVPNANAASRQIAVKMGLIRTHHSVTEGERDHGHRCTYSLDTLEADIRDAGLTVMFRGGVCFKPFANFQFDLLMKNKVIDTAYLEGCYALGMHYPDLCASVYAICERTS